MKRVVVIAVFFLAGALFGWGIWAPTLAWFSLPNDPNAQGADLATMAGFVLSWGLLFASAPLGAGLRGQPPLAVAPLLLYLILGGLISGLVAYYFHALHTSTATLAARLGGKGALTIHRQPITRIPLIGAAFVFVMAGTQRLLASAKPSKER